MGEETVSPSHDATVLRVMIVAAAVEEIDREETMTQATVVETMIVSAVRQNEDAVAVSDGMMTKAAGVSNDEHSQQKLAHVRAVGTSTRADACACAVTGDPQPRWFELTLL